MADGEAEGGSSLTTVESPAAAAAAPPVVASPGIRVVRCPKCGKYLPEMEEFKIYRCGSCSAVLQVKRSIHKKVVSSEKSNGENLMSEKAGRPSTKKEMPLIEENQKAKLADNGDKHIENDEVSLGRRSRESNGSPSSVSSSNENKMMVFNGHDNTKHDYQSEETIPLAKAPVENSSSNVNEMSKTCSSESRESKQKRERTMEDNSICKGGDDDGSSWSPGVPRRSPKSIQFTCENGIPTICKGEDEDGSSWSPGVARQPPKSIQFTRENCIPTEQPSPTNNHHEHKVPKGLPERVKHLQDPAELLKTLDLIRDQLTRPHEVGMTDIDTMNSSRNKNTAPVNLYASHCLQFPEGSSSSEHMIDHPFPLRNRSILESQSYHSKFHPQDDVFVHGESSGSWPVRQTSFQTANMYHQRHEGFYQQPICSCRHCQSNHPKMHSQAMPPCFRKQNDAYGVNNYDVDTISNPAFSYSDNYTGINTSLHSQQPRRQQRSMPRNRCEAFAGGSPFIICQNCFELLQVPQQVLYNGSDRKKLQCGSCLQVIRFKMTRHKRMISTPPEPGNVENGMGGSPNSDLGANCVLPDSRFEGYGNNGHYPFSYHIPNEMTEKEDFSDSSESENMVAEGEPPYSSDTQADYYIPHATIYKRNVPKSLEIPKQPGINMYMPILPSEGNYSPSPNREVNCPELLSTEMKYLQVNNNTNLDLPQTSNSMNVEEEELKESGESFFAGLRKSIKARSNRPTRKEKFKVLINGHRIPDHLVKKAETRAGKIQNGEYWYDYRAGFWGVMGEPCMGIIPPFIEEFNYPMPKKCAAGNTAILVNGRELNHRDLQLLVDRGLPKASGKSYIIEISGKVTDAISGEEIDGLGKLAPTIEKLKHGFGMKHQGITGS